MQTMPWWWSYDVSFHANAILADLTYEKNNVELLVQNPNIHLWQNPSSQELDPEPVWSPKPSCTRILTTPMACVEQNNLWEIKTFQEA